MKSKLFASVLACFVAALSVRGEILMYEGFPTGEGGYSASSANLAGQEVTSSSVYGFAEKKFASATYVYSHGENQDLHFQPTFLPRMFLAVTGRQVLRPLCHGQQNMHVIIIRSLPRES